MACLIRIEFAVGQLLQSIGQIVLLRIVYVILSSMYLLKAMVKLPVNQIISIVVNGASNVSSDHNLTQYGSEHGGTIRKLASPHHSFKICKHPSPLPRLPTSTFIYQ